jgi:parallel beta-helix repeat protein
MYGISVDARDVVLSGLRIKNFQRWGISIVNASSCVLRASEITGNQIGLEIQAGSAGAGPTLIGGSVTADRNVFSRNVTAISVWNGAHDVQIAGNLIGTDATGAAAAANSSYGIYVDNASVVIHDNVISGNQIAGIELERGAGTKLVENNRIGTDITGTVAIPNANGIRVRGATSEITGNTISGNSGVGVYLTGAQCVGTKIRGNLIGTTVAGNVALGNEYGIQIDDSASGSIIGGTALADRNVISGNYLGLYVLNLQTTFNLPTQTRDHQITGNYIGPAIDGGTMGNQLAVYIYGAAQNTLTSNRVVGNASSGIAILGQFAIDNTVRQNIIADNGGLPIDLEYDGVTPNDSFDADTGANNHQNFPDLQVSNANGITQVGGMLSTTNLGTFTLDFFKTPSCAGSPAANEYISSTTVMTNAAGNGQFLVTIPNVLDGTGIVATATSSSGSTSELSYCASASACIPPQIQTTIPQATVGFGYQQQIGGFFPTGAYTFTLIAGNLPAGMSLAADGWLSGVPQDAGTYAFTVRVTDVTGCSGDYELSLYVCPTIDITPAVLPLVQPNVPFDITFTATGGLAPYQFYFQEGPESGFIPGVQLYPQGILHGTPTTIGNFSFSLDAYDSNGCTGQRYYTLSVGCAALYLDPDALPLGDVGAPYDVVLNAMGGTPPDRFTASQLPEGLQMSPGGHITGKPRMRGLTPVTITVLDGVNCSLELTLGLEVVVLDEPGCESTTGHGSPALVLFVVVVLARRRRQRAATA